MSISEIARELSELFGRKDEFDMDYEIHKILLKYDVLTEEEKWGVYNDGMY